MYRIDNGSYYDGKWNYCIERKNNKGKWRFVFGGCSLKKAQHYINNPDEIRKELNKLKIGGVFCILIFVWGIYACCI